MLSVVFLVTFLLGCYLINYKIITSRASRLKSKLDSLAGKEVMERLDTAIFHEISEIVNKINTNIYEDIIWHFCKNIHYERLWERDLLDQGKGVSFGGYRIKKIIQGREKEIYLETSLIPPKTIIYDIIKKGQGYKFSIYLEKEMELVNDNIKDKIKILVLIGVEYNQGNKDIYSPDVATIKEMEVSKDD